MSPGLAEGRCSVEGRKEGKRKVRTERRVVTSVAPGERQDAGGVPLGWVGGLGWGFFQFRPKGGPEENWAEVWGWVGKNQPEGTGYKMFPRQVRSRDLEGRKAQGPG